MDASNKKAVKIKNDFGSSLMHHDYFIAWAVAFLFRFSPSLDTPAHVVIIKKLQKIARKNEHRQN